MKKGRPKTIDHRRDNHRPRKRGRKPKQEQEPDVLYTIHDTLFGELKIKKTDSGWWTEKEKVERLISAWKLDATELEACGYAGISRGQYDYFFENFKELSAIKALCNNWPNMKARNTIVQDLEDVETAQWYAERKIKNEFSKRVERTGARGGPIQYELADENKKKIDEILDDNTPIAQNNADTQGGKP